MASSEVGTDAEREGDGFLRAIGERASAGRAAVHVRGGRVLAVAMLAVALVVIVVALIAAGDRAPAVPEAASMVAELIDAPAPRS